MNEGYSKNKKGKGKTSTLDVIGEQAESGTICQEPSRQCHQSSCGSAMDLNNPSYSSVGGKRMKKVLLDDSAGSEERNTISSVTPHRLPITAVAAPFRRHRRSSIEDPSNSLFNFGSMFYWNEDCANDEENSSLQQSSASTQPTSEDLIGIAIPASNTNLQLTAAHALKSDSEATSDMNILSSSGTSPRDLLSSDVSSSEEGRRKTPSRRRISKKMHPDFVSTTSSVKKKTRMQKKSPKAKDEDFGGISIPAQSMVIGSTGSISNIPSSSNRSSVMTSSHPLSAQVSPQKSPVSILMGSPTAGQMSPRGIMCNSSPPRLSNVKLTLGPRSPSGGMGVVRIVSPTAGNIGQPVSVNMSAQKSLAQHLIAPMPGAQPSSALNLLQSISAQPSDIKHISIARSSSGNISVQSPSGVQIRSTRAMSNDQMIIIKKHASGVDAMTPLSAVQKQKFSQYIGTPHISDVAAVCEIDCNTVGSGMSIVGNMKALEVGVIPSDDVASSIAGDQPVRPGPSGIGHSRLDVNMSVLDTAFRQRSSTAAQSGGSHGNACSNRVVTDDHGYCKRGAAASVNLENVIDLL